MKIVKLILGLLFIAGWICVIILGLHAALSATYANWSRTITEDYYGRIVYGFENMGIFLLHIWGSGIALLAILVIKIATVKGGKYGDGVPANMIIFAIISAIVFVVTFGVNFTVGCIANPYARAVPLFIAFGVFLASLLLYWAGASLLTSFVEDVRENGRVRNSLKSKAITRVVGFVVLAVIIAVFTILWLVLEIRVNLWELVDFGVDEITSFVAIGAYICAIVILFVAGIFTVLKTDNPISSVVGVIALGLVSYVLAAIATIILPIVIVIVVLAGIATLVGALAGGGNRGNRQATNRFNDNNNVDVDDSSIKQALEVSNAPLPYEVGGIRLHGNSACDGRVYNVVGNPSVKYVKINDKYIRI